MIANNNVDEFARMQLEHSKHRNNYCKEWEPVQSNPLNVVLSSGYLDLQLLLHSFQEECGVRSLT